MFILLAPSLGFHVPRFAIRNGVWVGRLVFFGPQSLRRGGRRLQSLFERTQGIWLICVLIAEDDCNPDAAKEYGCCDQKVFSKTPVSLLLPQNLRGILESLGLWQRHNKNSGTLRTPDFLASRLVRCFEMLTTFGTKDFQGSPPSARRPYTAPRLNQKYSPPDPSAPSRMAGDWKHFGDEMASIGRLPLRQQVQNAAPIG